MSILVGSADEYPEDFTFQPEVTVGSPTVREGVSSLVGVKPGYLETPSLTVGLLCECCRGAGRVVYNLVSNATANLRARLRRIGL